LGSHIYITSEASAVTDMTAADVDTAARCRLHVRQLILTRSRHIHKAALVTIVLRNRAGVERDNGACLHYDSACAVVAQTRPA
jgi:ribosomal protein L14